MIIAHCSGIETNFSKALVELANDEERKGNMALATQFRAAYESKRKPKLLPVDMQPNGSVFASQIIQPNIAPRDKDSMLDLYEIINSNVGLSEVILPPKQYEVLIQLIEEQKNATKLLEQNILPANRLLLCGPPGCGKTMTAKAIAAELKLSMAYVRLDGLVSSFLGQTSINLRKIFDSVKNQHIVLFLDEFDAIAKKRDDAHELGELKRVVTTLLQNFDNMQNNVFLIAATNHQHLLDPAIWRRFNVTLILNLPEVEQRKEMITVLIKNFNIKADLDIELLSRVTEGLSYAQIKELVTASAKSYIISGENINNDTVINLLLQQLSFCSSNKENMIDIMKSLNAKGITMRTLEKITGIPKSTVNYKLKSNT